MVVRPENGNSKFVAFLYYTAVLISNGILFNLNAQMNANNQFLQMRDIF